MNEFSRLWNQAQSIFQEMEYAKTDEQSVELLNSLDSYEKYSRNYLCQSPTPQQIAIAKSLDEAPFRTLVPSANNVGKCIQSDQYIPLSDGRMVRAGDLIDKRFTILDIRDGKSVAVDAFAEDNGLKTTYRIEFDTGEVIERTGNHPLWTTEGIFRSCRTPVIPSGGWVKCSEIKVGTLVAMPIDRDYFASVDIPEDELKIIAYMIGDGGMTTTSLTFTQMPGKQLEEFTAIAERMGCEVVNKKHHSGSICNNGVRGTEWRKNRIADILREYGLLGCHSRDKRIPDRVFSCSKQLQAVFLSRLYATDGWASVSKQGGSTCREIGFCSVSERLCLDVMELLHRFGIRANIRRRDKVNAWVVDIRTKTDLEIFASRIGIYGKEDAVAKVLEGFKHSRNKWQFDNAPKNCRWNRVKSIAVLENRHTVSICVPDGNTFCTSVLEHNTFLMGSYARYFYEKYDPSEVLITATTAGQVRDGVFKEIRSSYPTIPGLLPRTTRAETSPNHYIHGYTSANPDAFQGRHSVHQAILFDEGTGIHPLIWERAGTMFNAVEGHAWLVTYNPNDPSTPPYAAEESGLWNVIRLNALEHPNIYAELMEKPAPIPSAVRLNRVLDRIATECEPCTKPDEDSPDKLIVFEFPVGSGFYWKPTTGAFEAQILGRWPLVATESLISPLQVSIAARTGFQVQDDWQLVISVDIARFGSDSTCFVVRRGPCVLDIELFQKRNSKWVLEHIGELLQKYSDAKERRAVPVIIDDTGGYGGGITDFATDIRIIPVNASSKSPSPLVTYNMRSHLLFRLSEALTHKVCDLTRISPLMLGKMREQLSAIRYRYDEKGRKRVEPKSQIKLRLGYSPDIADALALSYYQYTN